MEIVWCLPEPPGNNKENDRANDNGDAVLLLARRKRRKTFLKRDQDGLLDTIRYRR